MKRKPRYKIKKLKIDTTMDDAKEDFVRLTFKKKKIIHKDDFVIFPPRSKSLKDWD